MQIPRKSQRNQGVISMICIEELREALTNVMHLGWMAKPLNTQMNCDADTSAAPLAC